MDIHQMNQVLKIAACGSINKAAAALYMSQSNLSQSIRKLEAECGHEIFIRTGSGIELTGFGRDYLRFAQDILTRYRQLEEFCQDDSQPVNILSVSNYHFRFVNLAFIETCNKYQEEHTQFSILENSIKTTCEYVQYHRCELGFIPIVLSDKPRMEYEFSKKGLKYTELISCSCLITCGSENPLYNFKGDQVPYSLLKNYPLAVYDDLLEAFPETFQRFDGNKWPRRISVSDQAVMNEVLHRTPAFTLNANLTSVYRKVPYYEGLRDIIISDKDIRLSIGYLQNTKSRLTPVAEDFLSTIHHMLVAS